MYSNTSVPQLESLGLMLSRRQLHYLLVVSQTVVTAQVSRSRPGNTQSDCPPALLYMDVTVPRTLSFCDLGSLRHVIGTGSLGQPLHLEAGRVTVDSVGCCSPAAVAGLPLACSVGDCMVTYFLSSTPDCAFSMVHSPGQLFRRPWGQTRPCLVLRATVELLLVTMRCLLSCPRWPDSTWDYCVGCVPVKPLELHLAPSGV